MAQTVFVKVIGFTDVERHALNTVFRLSETRETVYSLWLDDAPEPPRLALIDGQSYEARLEAELPHHAGLKLIWVGEMAPFNSWRTFDRPLAWPEVVHAMDELFAPPPELDFDIDVSVEGEAEDTQPPESLPPDTQPPDTLPPDTLPPEPGEPQKRALIASADRDERLYLRAKLALADLTQADEAETGAQALELARMNRYTVALVDFGLPDVDGWTFLKELSAARPQIPHVIVTKSNASVGERVRAWFAGTDGFFDKPPHPGKLQDLLEKIEAR